MVQKAGNELSGESSPYLLQHADNPVHWKPWNEESLALAGELNRPLLISIGYAACHWCHVMEHESFEDPEVAAVMNAHFINIKVDREERPDVDQVYMDALQLITGRGGWPLNIVALPDGRPFWGATYVPKDEWITILSQLSRLFREEHEKVVEYAEKLTAGVRGLSLFNLKPSGQRDLMPELNAAVQSWTRHMDPENGGFKGAPKFMMPVLYNFLLHYTHTAKQVKLEDHLHLTLEKMAYGGVYDHIGGGFARYSVDERWHIPHFEKMLYDNAQLIGLYARAYAVKPHPLYRDIVSETVAFLQRELMHPEGIFYSSLDADSETDAGKMVEGAFYRWDKDELQQVLGDDFELAAAYFNFNETGQWEDNFYVPIRTLPQEEVARQYSLGREELKKKMEDIKSRLLSARSSRTRPRLDNKILCSWNALLAQGLFSAARYLDTPAYGELAVTILDYLGNRYRSGNTVYRTRDGKKGVQGFLDDYAGLLLAYLDAYEFNFDDTWLHKAGELADIIVKKFHDPSSGLFFYTPDDGQQLIRRSLEMRDNVIPSSNSFLLHGFFKLHRYFPGEGYDTYYQGLAAYLNSLVGEPYNYANWLHAVLWEARPYYEIAITGEGFLKGSSTLKAHYLPNAVFAATGKPSPLPLLENRIKEGETLYYLCENGSCQLPVRSAAEVLDQLP